MQGLPSQFRTQPTGQRLPLAEGPTPTTFAALPQAERGARSVDPTILRRIREIDDRIVVEWNPLGIWWWPISRVPPGASRGCWRLGMRGKSGLIRWSRHWPPDCADGRLVDFLHQTVGRNLFLLRSTTRDRFTTLRQLEAVRKREAAVEQARQDAWWNSIDHGGFKHAVQQDRNDPKWRSNWNVPAALDRAGAASGGGS